MARCMRCTTSWMHCFQKDPLDRADAQPLWRPQHVHRLDAPTSGLLVVAKTGAALRTLSACFAARLVRKKYVAVVAGALPPAAAGLPAGA